MASEQVLRRVKVEGGTLKFSAAHFITYGGKCERLHGHNYGVLVEVEGSLGVDGLVFDFTLLKRYTREICQQLDHRFLLPVHNPHLKLTASAEYWEIQFGEKLYVFPRADVAELPIANSTAELLAEYICEQLLLLLDQHDIAHLSRITVGVEEAPTQMAYYQREVGVQGE